MGRSRHYAPRRPPCLPWPAGQKNAAAARLLQRVLREATWLNLHMLPHSTPVFEARVVEGYGARWTLPRLQPAVDGGRVAAGSGAAAGGCGMRLPPGATAGLALFRGFVEPAMEDGHAAKWRH